MKSTVTEIKERFDKDVERFSDINSGQVSTMDAKISLELITQAAYLVFSSRSESASRQANLLDIGAGAGNYSIQMAMKLPQLNCTLVDLSLPMLTKAEERFANYNVASVTTIQGDIRTVSLVDNTFDIVLAGAVLHHLRTDQEWEFVFQKIYDSLAIGGSFWISDLVSQETSEVNELMQQRYSDYLIGVGGESYKDNVLAYIEKEDTPHSVTFQLELLRKVGFKKVEILHKNACFAAFGAIKI